MKKASTVRSTSDIWVEDKQTERHIAFRIYLYPRLENCFKWKWFNDSSRTEVLANFIKFWTIVLGIDFLGVVSDFIWPKKKRDRLVG
ncbi:hypothetical protein [Virgibacillus necropolis]|uniref:Uncharacterized protein n=1 Tax=Virgibacillus necropolis TaxID=163877 RepID=A0A221MC99_9BACI|nr:hypothetical protein [Virgibacillus necropolis]ASN05264.1 hypothetical protein CFK40_09665 [Virgibacillus necropolis]